MSENYLIHFGNKNSGRYRRGSGENPHQHDGLGTMGKGKYNSRHDRRVAERMDRKAIRKSDNFFTRNLLFNGATYRRAAQISANNKDISKKAAKYEAKTAAIRNTGLGITAIALGSAGSRLVSSSHSTIGKSLGTGLLAASAGTTLGTIMLNHKEKKMARTGQYTKYLKSKGQTPGA